MNNHSTPQIVCEHPEDVAAVSALPDFRLRVRFHGGLEGEVDMSNLISSPQAGVFAALRDIEVFAKADVHYGAVTWPGELDLAPDAMYEEILKNGTWVLR